MEISTTLSELQQNDFRGIKKYKEYMRREKSKCVNYFKVVKQMEKC